MSEQDTQLQSVSTELPQSQTIHLISNDVSPLDPLVKLILRLERKVGNMSISLGKLQQTLADATEYFTEEEEEPIVVKKFLPKKDGVSTSTKIVKETKSPTVTLKKRIV